MKASLPALRAFDAAALHGSFRAAAEVLSVTPTAISHHIRGLEDQLGAKLFYRKGRDVVLTEDGRRLAKATHQAFGILDDAVDSLRGNARKAVRLMAGPIVTARWLMPRISDLWATHPDIELEVVPSSQPGVQDTQNVDIVVRWARMGDMTGSATKLLELRPVAIASERFISTHGPIEHPSDLLKLPLLHQKNHWGWLDWFATMEVPVKTPLNGPIFQDSNVLLRGAAEAQGVTIGWLPLIDPDLAEGRVVRLFDEDIAPTHAYFVDVVNRSSMRREVRHVENWLIAQSAA